MEKLKFSKEVLDSYVIFSPVTLEDGFAIRPLHGYSHDEIQILCNKGWKHVKKTYREILNELGTDFEEEVEENPITGETTLEEIRKRYFSDAKNEVTVPVLVRFGDYKFAVFTFAGWDKIYKEYSRKVMELKTYEFRSASKEPVEGEFNERFRIEYNRIK